MLELQQITLMRFAILILLALAIQVHSGCSDASSCFVQKLFDFTYPAQGVYNITLNSPGQPQNYFPMGYGDFNNDLRTDYVALDPISNNLLIFNYSSSPTEGEYTLHANISTAGCNPLNLYLYDVDNSQGLDIVVWGQYSNSTKCLYLLLQINGQFVSPTNQTTNFDPTNTQPFLFESRIAGTRRTYFLIYDVNNNSRTIFEYTINAYAYYPWTDFFDDSTYTTIPFSDPHWNSFIDLTNDCYSDIVINNQAPEIEFWIYNAGTKKFSRSLSYTTPEITSMTFLDINYDGIQDIITAQPSSISMYLGTVPTPSDFCVQNKTSFGFDWNNPIVVSPQNCVLISQSIHFGDLNINGYPDLMFTCTTNGLNTLHVYQNQMQNDRNFSPFTAYQQVIDTFITNKNLSVTRASFFDVLENGIIDFMVNVESGTVVLYNNYLYQNFYYIKGYATNGETNRYGNQVPGATFYYLNSLGNMQKVAIYSQMIQTAYNAMPMPYIVTGLGRANNYVQQFTLGRLGDRKSWSPIIPNSQLAVFSGDTTQNWSIKIFIMPTDSIVYVIIVCIVILTVLGVILIVLKCLKKKREQGLIAMDYM